MPEVIVEMGSQFDEKDIRFNVEVNDYNEYLNSQMPTDKIGPAYNFLITTVHPEDKATFKELVLVDKKPNGMSVMLIVGEITNVITGDFTVKIKKPKASQSK